MINRLGHILSCILFVMEDDYILYNEPFVLFFVLLCLPKKVCMWPPHQKFQSRTGGMSDFFDFLKQE
jgi:hypothetical protein